jgi:hypothetical protein
LLDLASHSYRLKLAGSYYLLGSVGDLEPVEIVTPKKNIRSKYFYCFHQAVYPGKFSEVATHEIGGRDPENFSGRD